ncbi:MAG: hypothetical protein EPO58_14080 [Chitinophagaceae bacterium]|nr:MAG: hypothetical protein EPO58_14080 [Chitinophagaceae bacterium]
MGKKKNKQSAKQRAQSVVPSNSSELTLEDILSDRVGGSVNFKGLNFQILYASFILLSTLSAETTISIRLEGIEDLDILSGEQDEYVQLKSSVNSIDAARFWELKILQNFLTVAVAKPTSYFKLVHNSALAKGNLDVFGSANVTDTQISFWVEKLKPAGYEIDASGFRKLLKHISIEKTTEKILQQQLIKLLYQKFSVGNQTEYIFLKALFYNIFQWSKQRKTVSFNDLAELIQSVKDSFSKAPTNEAITHNWIQPVSFNIEPNESAFDYFEGKAARPIHIAMDLPVKRPAWEKTIIDKLGQSSIVVVKSSSGQGKSTLAWQVGKALVGKGNTVYQLGHCADWQEANAIRDFIETRLIIGEWPLIIIDGLSQTVSSWALLAEQFADKPVKFLITTREEDWFRYGADISRVSLQVIDIKLTLTEAEEIYRQLKRNGKIHAGVSAWQSAWENIGTKGLLIEYVYLLTSGQMISERLTQQVKQLQSEKDAAAKTEILRLVSLADTLNVRLKTSTLTNYINETVRFESDRNEVYRQLEKEYYLKFGSDYVEGLHPVRSQHLVDILHSHTPVEDSLIAVLIMLDTESVYDYFIAAPFYVTSTGKNEFYRKEATILGKRTFPEMVYATDGILHYEASMYWQKNKILFDEAFVAGGLELFVYDATPFHNLNTLAGFSETTKDIPGGGNIQILADKLKNLSTYNMADSDIIIFVRHLQDELKKRPVTTTAEGVVFLSKWFKKLGLDFPDIIDLSEDKLLNVLEKEDIGQSSDLFQFYRISQPEKYKRFVATHRQTIFSWIKIKTDTLRIFEKDENIHMEYLLSGDAGNENEKSVFRINIAHAFFDDYKRYCTDLHILPFPNEEIYKVTVQNAHKEMPAENIFHTFDVHLNQIWSKTILRNYASVSGYDWQNQYFKLRKQAVEVARKCIRVFEHHLTGDGQKLKTAGKDFLAQAGELLQSQQVAKNYPSFSAKYFDDTKFKQEQKDIDAFFASYRNFLNQSPGIFSPEEEQDRRLPIINLKNTLDNLSKMQAAFASITTDTVTYFPFDSLNDEELQWYKRLLLTAQFYIHHISSRSSEKIVVPQRAAEDWQEAERLRELNHLHKIIRDFEQDSHFQFFVPGRIFEEGILKSTVIGVQNCDLIDTEQNNLFELSMGLNQLAGTGIHFFTFLFLDASKKITGSLRFSESYFDRFKVFHETGEYDEEDQFSVPLPIPPTAEMIEALGNGIHTGQTNLRSSDEAYYKMLMEIWQLSQYRIHSKSTGPESKWLGDLENKYAKSILDHANNIYQPDTPVTEPSREAVLEFLNRKRSFDTDEIVQLMTTKAAASM